MSEQIHYMVTLPDGTVPPTSACTGSYPLINLAEHLGPQALSATPRRTSEAPTH